MKTIPPTLFEWEKTSWKRYTAKVGQLSISIRKKGKDGSWSVDHVFGSSVFGADYFLDPVKAMHQAEYVAQARLKTAVAAFGPRWGRR